MFCSAVSFLCWFRWLNCMLLKVTYRLLDFEEIVEFSECCFVDFLLGFCGIHGGQYAFRLFTNAIEESLFLL